MKLVVPLFSILLYFTQSFHAQLSYKTNLETGLLFESATANINKSTNVYKLLGDIKYRTSYQNSESTLSLKIRPEILGEDFYALKFGAQGEYIYYGNDATWKTYLTYQNFEYSLKNDNYSISSFNIITGADFEIPGNIPTQLFIGYSYQNVEFLNTLSSDYIYLDAKAQNYTSGYSSVSTGLFIENFISKGYNYFSSNPLESKGWYYGPQISFNYLKNFLFNFGYKFLLLNSNNLQNPSFEHRVNALGGIKLSNYFSLFLYIDYYFRDAKQKNSSTENFTLLPTKNENHITFKINYKLKSNFSLYLKSGYFRENLFSENNHLDGMNFLFGLELKN